MARKDRPNKLQIFRQRATVDEWALLAWYAETSPDYLRQIAHRYKDKTPSVIMAYRIEHGTRLLKRANRSLPIVTCHDIAEMILNK